MIAAFLDDCRLRNLQTATVDQKRRCLARLEKAWGDPLEVTTVELRAKEISGLRGEHIQWHLDPPILIVEEQKGGDMGAVPLAPVLVDELAGHPRTGWVFPRRDGKPGPTPPWLVSRLCNDHLHSIGITHTLHTARHRFGTQVYRASGRDLRLTQELLRHKTPVSTAIYTWVDPADGAQAVTRLPTFG